VPLVLSRGGPFGKATEVAAADPRAERAQPQDYRFLALAKQLATLRMKGNRPK
jgi:hypothetical protein